MQLGTLEDGDANLHIVLFLQNHEELTLALILHHSCWFRVLLRALEYIMCLTFLPFCLRKERTRHTEAEGEMETFFQPPRNSHVLPTYSRGGAGLR